MARTKKYIDGEWEELTEEDLESSTVGLPAVYEKKRGRSVTGGEATMEYRTEIWERRQTVAALRARNMSAEEIQAEMVNMGFVNPISKEPWSLSVIRADFKTLINEWKKNAEASTSKHISRLLAELTEVKRAAWRREDLTTVLLAIDREAKMLGLYAPTTHRIIVDDKIKEYAELYGLDPAELKSTMEAIAEGKTI